MPAIKRPNQDALYFALNVYRDAMRSFIVRNLQSVGDMRLQEAIEKSLWREERLKDFQQALRRVRGDDTGDGLIYVEEIEASIDVNMFSDIICKHWDTSFAAVFNEDMEKVSEALTEITRARNDVSHPGLRDISSGRTQNTLQRMSRILSKAKALEGMDEVNRILDTLSQFSEGTTVQPDFDPVSQFHPDHNIANLILNEISSITANSRADIDRVADQTAERVAQVLRLEQPSPAEITDEVLRRLLPALAPLPESPMAAQTAIDAAVIERLERLTNPAEIAEQAARKVTEAMRQERESSATQTDELRDDFNRLAQQVADALEMQQPRPPDSGAESAESMKQLRQDFQALAQQLAGAIENLQGPQSGEQPRPTTARPSRAAESASKYEPGNIEDNWKAVAQHLNRIKGKREASLGGLLRSARPVDIWMDLDGEKLMLPFKSPVILSKIQEELSYQEVREVIAESIARHFGKPLEIEPVLLNQTG